MTNLADLREKLERRKSCPDCGGEGERFDHSPWCGNDNCALAGDIDDCDGVVVDCHCRIDLADAAVNALPHLLDLLDAKEAREREMREALEDFLHAVCGETGFAAAVRNDSGLAYPWPALDIVEEKARAVLSNHQPDGDDLAWLSEQHSLSLEYYSPVYGDDDDQSREWRVHSGSGSINDREWTIVGRGEAAADAIRAARLALSAGGGAK